MNVIPLIGKNLKSDEIVELLEFWDAEVIYDFDRLHENMPDSYHVTINSYGIELLFNEAQNLTTAFLQILPSGEMSTFDVRNSDVKIFASLDEAKIFATSNELSIREGKATFLGTNRIWIKHFYEKYTIHYEFIEEQLNKITVAALDDIQ